MKLSNILVLLISGAASTLASPVPEAAPEPVPLEDTVNFVDVPAPDPSTKITIQRRQNLIVQVCGGAHVWDWYCTMYGYKSFSGFAREQRKHDKLKSQSIQEASAIFRHQLPRNMDQANPRKDPCTDVSVQAHTHVTQPLNTFGSFNTRGGPSQEAPATATTAPALIQTRFQALWRTSRSALATLGSTTAGRLGVGFGDCTGAWSL
ncbi:hypothetical protein V8F06_007896 [Rhypophila decipiens]